jgi:hypothetical protein
VITCEEFAKVFLNMGIEERTKEMKEAVEKQRRAEKARIRKLEKQKAELDSKNLLKVSYTYTEQEFQSAMHKLTEAAWRLFGLLVLLL